MTCQMNSASLSRRLKRLYYHLNFIHLLVPMKFLLGFSAKTLQCCTDLFLTHQFVNDLFPQYGIKAANITPIQKSSPPKDVDSDFRPISLTQSFPYKWLLNSVSKKINPLQFGSLKDSSTSMALVYMLHKWYEAADNQGNTIRICLLDFSKAFDRLDHNILLKKLKDMEIHPVLLNWIANFLTDRQQRTHVGQFFSEWKSINAGVPQGTISLARSYF